MTTVILDAEIHGRVVDVRIEGTVVTAVERGLSPAPGDSVIDAAGHALLPGLHDHHVHLLSSAASLTSVAAGPPLVSDAAGLSRGLRAAAAGLAPGRWIRAVGYHRSVAGDLDRHGLDALVADRPVRVQHRSGALWILNSEAVRVTGLDRCRLSGVERDAAGLPTGRLWRMDDWLATVVPSAGVDLADVSRRAAAAGVTGFTDASPAGSPAAAAGLVDSIRSGRMAQRVHLMSGHHTRPDRHDRLSEGPFKVMLDDDDLPPVDRLAAVMAHVHGEGRPVAVHCVTRVQLLVALLALGQAGTHRGDRIEHGAVVPPEMFGDLRTAGATVVTQPNFVAERGDRYLEEVDADDLPHLYRCASLAAAGIPVAAGTDAPFGDADPWAAMRAAVGRRTAGGTVLGPSERVRALTALRLFLGRADLPAVPRRIQPGAPADLCLLRVPLRAALDQLTASLVAMTMIAGDVVHPRP